MTDYYCSEAGAGAHDGSSQANAWDVSEIDWATIVAGVNTLFLGGTITSRIVVGATPGIGEVLTISGAVSGNPGILDGSLGHSEMLIIFQRERFIIEDLSIINISDKGFTINNSSNITLRRNAFSDSLVSGDMRGIWIYTPLTSNLVADIEISDNTFTNFGTKTPASNNPTCIYVSYNVTDASSISGFVVRDNEFTDCNNALRMNLNANSDPQLDGTIGLEIDGNTVTRCEHAFQQINWRDGSGVSPSWIRNNTFSNSGSGGASGTVASNVIQLEACTAGDVSNNIFDGWEKINGGGDGHAIILDWAHTDTAQYCDSVQIFGNEFYNGGALQTDAGTTMNAVHAYRTKDCMVYSNLIVNCRGGIGSAGQTVVPANSQGNVFYNNTIVGSNTAFRFDVDSQEVATYNNIVINSNESAFVNVSAVAPVWDYQCLFNNDSDSLSGANDVTNLPLLHWPTYIPSFTSAVIGAGTPTVLPLDDINGVAFANPPNIGAYATSLTRASDTGFVGSKIISPSIIGSPIIGGGIIGGSPGGVNTAGRVYAVGDGVMRATLDTPIPVVGADPFTFSVDAVQDTTIANQYYISKAADSNYCQVRTSASGVDVTFNFDDNFVQWTGLNTAVANNEAFNLQIVNINGADVRCIITGVDSGVTELSYKGAGNNNISANSADFNQIGQSSGGGDRFRNAMANLSFTQYGDTYVYPIFEETPDTSLVNYGNTVTPSNYDGTWAAPNWVLIDPNPWA